MGWTPLSPPGGLSTNGGVSPAFRPPRGETPWGPTVFRQKKPPGLGGLKPFPLGDPLPPGPKAPCGATKGDSPGLPLAPIWGTPPWGKTRALNPPSLPKWGTRERAPPRAKNRYCPKSRPHGPGRGPLEKVRSPAHIHKWPFPPGAAPNSPRGLT